MSDGIVRRNHEQGEGSEPLKLIVVAFECPQCGAVKLRTKANPRGAHPSPNCSDCAVPTVFGSSTKAGVGFVQMRELGEGILEIDT